MGMESCSSSAAQLQPPPPPPRLRPLLSSSPHLSPPPHLIPDSFGFSDLQLVVSGNGISKPSPTPPPPPLPPSPQPPLRSPRPRQSPSRLRIDGTGDADEVEDGRREEREQKRRSKNWSRLETLTLIRTRTEMNPKFCRGGRKRELWSEISEHLCGAHFSRDAQQCRDKWEKLMSGYKDVKEGLKDREDNPYFEELHPLMSKQQRDGERERERENERGGYYCQKEEEEDEEEEEEEEEEDEEEEEEEDEEDEQQEEELGDEQNGNEDEEGEDSFNISCSSSSKRKRKHRQLSAIDMGSVKYLLDTVIAHQHKFFRELMETMEKNEQAREKVRIEKEEKWRAEERAHREVLNNAMLLLTQAILRDHGGGGNLTMNTNNSNIPASVAVEPVPKQSVSVPTPKKRSKNWKRGEVLQLIQLRGAMDSRFVNSSRRGLLWDELAEALDNRGIKRDGKQCREKWDKLMASYKDVIDGRRDEGDLSYFLELKNIVGQRPPDNGFAGCCSVQFEEHCKDKITTTGHHRHRHRMHSDDIS